MFMYVLGACTCHVVHVQVSGKLSEIASPLPAVSKDLIQVFRIAGQASLPIQSRASLQACLYMDAWNQTQASLPTQLSCYPATCL